MNKRILMAAFLTAILIGFQATQVVAQDAWGTLTGKVVVDGEPPKNLRENVEGSPDKPFCLVDGMVPEDDSILVGKDGGLKNVLVMMYIANGEEDPKPHPSYDEAKKQPVTIDNIKCRFVPHVLFVRPRQKLIMKNSDPIGHNCHITTLNNEISVNLPAGAKISTELTESDKAPGVIVCDMHKWMDSVILVRDNPYVAITDAEGNFKIENVPVGNWKFHLWHKKVGYLSALEVPEKELGRRGDFEVEIPADGVLDLGTLKLPNAAFKE